MKHSPPITCGIESNAGYTIIEVLIAIAIFSIGLMAMSALQTSSLMATGDITRQTEAWSILDDQAATLKSMPFYRGIAGMDYNDDGNPDPATAFPPALTAGVKNLPTPDGRYQINWQVDNNQPIAAVIVPSPLTPPITIPITDLPPGTYTVSKTITIWVTRTGSVAQADALAMSQFVKTWMEDL